MSAINPISHPARARPAFLGVGETWLLRDGARVGRAGAHESLSSLKGDLFGTRSESLLATLTFDFANQTAPTKRAAAGGGELPAAKVLR